MLRLQSFSQKQASQTHQDYIPRSTSPLFPQVTTKDQMPHATDFRTLRSNIHPAYEHCRAQQSLQLHSPQNMNCRSAEATKKDQMSHDEGAST